MATLDTSSSSDEDLYDNFSKYKKAVLHESDMPQPKLPKASAAPSGDSSSEDSETVPTDEEDNAGLSLAERLKRMTSRQKALSKDQKPKLDDIDAEIERELNEENPTRKAKKAKPDRVPKAVKIARTVRAQIEKDEAAERRREEQRLRELDEYEEKMRKEQEASAHCKIHMMDYTNEGPNLIIDWRMTAPFTELVGKYAKIFGIRDGRARLWHNMKPLALDSTPERERFSRTDVNVVEYLEDMNVAPTAVLENQILLKFQVKGGKPVSVPVGKDEPFADIKQRLAKTPGFGEVALLLFDGDAVGNDDTPADLDMEGEECVDVVLKTSN
ncbi:hypothetical protein AAVH_26444 [Aphelenchoides avenae]|nr:hypothetical protein AAVH_26444 [Aphelenchus avenae]